MPFYLYLNNKIETLVQDHLCNLLQEQRKDPFAKEVIIVQNQGMATYLKQKIALKNTIAFNIDFPFINNYVNNILENSKISSSDYEYFLPDNMCWQIFELLATDGQNYQELKNYLKGNNKELKQYQLARNIARIFDQYQIFRPDMILKWEQQGQNTTNNWQIDFWNKISYNKTSRSKILYDFFNSDSLKNITISDRVSLFGIFSMPPVYLAFFKQLSRYTDVHFFYFTPFTNINPCSVYKKKTDFANIDVYFQKENKNSLHDNSLLLSHGKTGRNFFDLLGNTIPETILNTNEKIQNPTSILTVIQNDICQNNVSDDLGLNPDNSITIHNCHSKIREIEVLHNFLLQQFEKKSIMPRDILVLTPDISQYAPYIKAVFDKIPNKNPQYIPYSIADTSIYYSNSVVKVFIKILQLPNSKITVNQIMEILETSAVYRKFSVTESDFELLKKWVKESGICWGIDEKYRKNIFGINNFSENSWQAGIDRMLLGYAMTDEKHDQERIWQGILPYDFIEGSSAGLLGNFLNFLNYTFHFAESLSRPRTIKEWSTELSNVLTTFFIDDKIFNSQITTIQNTINTLLNISEKINFKSKISLETIRNYLEEKFIETAKPGGFFRGNVTFCTMQPMRNIPSKILCLLGMNDGDFPRTEKQISFDLTKEKPRICDRSKRGEDKYLFLEALLSARENLFISYVGQDIKTNEHFPPATSISELIDYIKKITKDNSISQIYFQHKFHPFAKEYFTNNDSRGFFSYSQSDARAAKALFQPKKNKLFYNQNTNSLNHIKNSVSLDEFITFFKNPSKYFIRNILNTRLENYNETALIDSEPFEIIGLENYKIINFMLQNILEEKPKNDLYKILHAKGILPIKIHGKIIFEKKYSDIENLLIHDYQDLEQKPIEYLRGSKDIDFEINMDEINIHGKLNFTSLSHMVYLRLASMKGKDAVEVWIRHLIFSIINKDKPVSTLCITGKNIQDKSTQLFHFPPINTQLAKNRLSELISIFKKGHNEPIPWFSKSSLTYVTKYEKKTRLNDVKASWNDKEIRSDMIIPGDVSDPYISLIFNESIIESEEFAKTALTILSPFLKKSDSNDNMYHVKEIKK